MNLITMTACNRPEYTRQVLDALAKCHGIEKYTLLAHIEPVSKEVEKLFHAWPHKWRITVNGSRLGNIVNSCNVMDKAVELSDFWCHLEDDIVPSPDFLDYMDWARHQYADDTRVFSISSYSREAPQPDEIYAVRRRKHFTAWGFGIWRHSWMKVRELARVPHDNPYKAWDTLINEYVVSQGLVAVFPVLSRCQNIGAVGGVHVPSAEWHAKNHHSEHVADCPAGPYFEK